MRERPTLDEIFSSTSQQQMPSLQEIFATPEVNTEDEIARSIAIPTKGVAQGFVGALETPFKLGSAINQSVARGIDKLTGMNVAERMSSLEASIPSATDKVGSLIEEFNQGRATPRNAVERAAQRTGEFIGSSAALQGTPLNIANKTELASVGGAGIASQASEELAPDNALLQAIAPLAGGLLTSGAINAPGAIKNLTARTLGIDPQSVDDFARLGVDPNLGAVGGRGSKIIQNTISEVPGSAGIIRKAAEKTIGQISRSVSKQADDLGTAATKTEGGEALQKGASAFVDRFGKKVDKLYGKLDSYIPSGTKVKVDNTQSFLQGIRGRFDDAPQLSAVFNDPIITKSIQAFDDISTPRLSSDVVLGAVSKRDSLLKYNTLRNLRSVVGRKLNSQALDGDTRATLKQMYGALSKDMEGAARSQGDKAYDAFKRANKFFAAGTNRIDQSLKKIIDADTPERAFSLATQGTKDGATQLVKIKKSLKPEEFGQLQSAVIRRMGEATPGAQGASGNIFSTNTYLTNWNKLAPEAKKVLFGGKNTELTKNMDNIANVVEKLKDVERLANTSGTAREVIAVGAGAGLIADPATAATLLGSSYVTANLITSPKFVKWLSNGLRMKNKGQLSKHISQLSTITASNPEIRSDINTYLQSIK